MYKKLAGMTGTADTEAEEFMSIYKLEVVVVPTNRPMIREDCPDVIYRTEKEKFDAVIEEVSEAKMFIDDSAALSVLDVRARARRLAAEQPLPHYQHNIMSVLKRIELRFFASLNRGCYRGCF